MTRHGIKIDTIIEALKEIRSGERIFIGSGSSAPQGIVEAIGENPGMFNDSEVTHISTLGPTPYTEPRFKNHLRHNALFIGSNTRQSVLRGDSDYTPVFLSEIPTLFRKKRIKIDIALIQVSPGSQSGMYSLGANVDVIRGAMEHARLVIAQVNRDAPYTFGQGELCRSEMDYLWDSDNMLPEHLDGELGLVELAIGRNVASLVQDGATLQLGIGKIPDAVAQSLKNKRDLGIHTEMFSDGMVDLIQSGAVTGRRKSTDIGLHVTSFVLGSQKVYDYVNDNPQVRFQECDKTNDPSQIAQHFRMTSVNSALEVDLTGQVVADSIGSRMYSGIGGQVDFTRGAARCDEGLPIIALPSTAKGGTLSRIKSILTPGSGVVTSRGDVHFVVTEYGIADLYGRTVEERALSLIEIAHPKFREELLTQAKELSWVSADHQVFRPDTFSEPNWMTELRLKGGVELWFRPLKPSDERPIQEFFYNHSQKSIYSRYGYNKKTLHHDEMVSRMRTNDQQVVFAAIEGSSCGRSIRGIARYGIMNGAKGSQQRFGEVGLIVEDGFQGRGLGKQMILQLDKFARSRQLDGLIFYVLKDNKGMRGLIENVYPGAETSHDEDQLCYKILFV